MRKPGIWRLWLPLVAAISLVLIVGITAWGNDDAIRVRSRLGNHIDNMDPAHYVGGEEYNIDWLFRV